MAPAALMLAMMASRGPQHDHEHDPLIEWVDRHPYTLAYVALVVTAVLILNLVETF
jgi:hypothetical protein